MLKKIIISFVVMISIFILIWIAEFISRKNIQDSYLAYPTILKHELTTTAPQTCVAFESLNNLSNPLLILVKIQSSVTLNTPLSINYVNHNPACDFSNAINITLEKNTLTYISIPVLNPICSKKICISFQKKFTAAPGSELILKSVNDLTNLYFSTFIQ